MQLLRTEHDQQFVRLPWRVFSMVQAQSYFSVDKKRLPELKERMRKLLQEFIQSAENDDGDTVAKIHLALFN